MRLKTVLTLGVVAALMAPSLPVVPAFAIQETFVERTFPSPIDAFSARLESLSFQYSAKTLDGWSPWTEYESDGDVGPGEESELIMLPRGTTSLRVKNIATTDDIHPITVSHEPVKTRVAAVNSVAMPSVISRSDWGATEDYLFKVPTVDKAPSDAAKGDTGGDTGQVSQRVKDCQSAQQNYPGEFSLASTAKTDAQGRTYLWPIQYSKEVKLLVVHHSALIVKDDPRPAVERVRALYKYHAVTNGWGDVGYNFLIDEEGKVYEGRLGGKYSVGGHAYCNNVGTLGIVMMGNFEMEQPSDAQAKSLQRLLANLASDYHIDTKKSVQFHGKKFDSPIVRHRDLLSTLCPGYYLTEAFGQVVKNVQTGNLNAAVIFPKKASSSSSSSSAPSTILNSDDALKRAPGITFIGRNAISINPGGKQRISFTYTADQSGAYEGKKVADIKLSDQRIKLWLDDGIAQIPVTKGILLQSDLPASESVSLQLIVQSPMDEGTYSMDIGGIHFSLSVSGRRTRSGEFINPFSGNSSMIVVPVREVKSTSLVSRIRPQSRLSSRSSSVASFRSSVSSSISPSYSWSPAAPATPFSSDASKPIRIRLSADAGPSITFSDTGTVGSVTARAGSTFDLLPRGSECEVRSSGERVMSAPVIRFSSSMSGILTASVIKGKKRSYRGVIECRVVNGTLALINELPLEDYMAGLAEEPDSEPYEKQRAFAIAARTYAAYYMDSANRKFPSMPYDGSDDPAVFQSYAGVDFTAANPNWLRAATSTQGSVLVSGGKLIKPPYFSSNDGRTRSPAEAGWKNFPFAEIFASKPDPWCNGMTLRGHGVGMSGCGAKGQANEGKSAEQILRYYYPGALLGSF
ncbi:MAG: N-acetylmuramoyl-L-alanine amidase [Candidatus Peribacteraceae bacterium]|nr:N-acetylmuramoyl-L-alanine amidase [Candidatus Peribacteraceae bacterium]